MTQNLHAQFQGSTQVFLIRTVEAYVNKLLYFLSGRRANITGTMYVSSFVLPKSLWMVYICTKWILQLSMVSIFLNTCNFSNSFFLISSTNNQQLILYTIFGQNKTTLIRHSENFLLKRNSSSCTPCVRFLSQFNDDFTLLN